MNRRTVIKFKLIGAIAAPILWLAKASAMVTDGLLAVSNGLTRWRGRIVAAEVKRNQPEEPKYSWEAEYHPSCRCSLIPVGESGAEEFYPANNNPPNR